MYYCVLNVCIITLRHMNLEIRLVMFLNPISYLLSHRRNQCPNPLTISHISLFHSANQHDLQVWPPSTTSNLRPLNTILHPPVHCSTRPRHYLRSVRCQMRSWGRPGDTSPICLHWDMRVRGECTSEWGGGRRGVGREWGSGGCRVEEID